MEIYFNQNFKTECKISKAHGVQQADAQDLKMVSSNLHCVKN